MCGNGVWCVVVVMLVLVAVVTERASHNIQNEMLLIERTQNHQLIMAPVPFFDAGYTRGETCTIFFYFPGWMDGRME